MSDLHINCKCGNKFRHDIIEGHTFKCSKCKISYMRYYNSQLDTYEIIIGDKNDR